MLCHQARSRVVSAPLPLTLLMIRQWILTIQVACCNVDEVKRGRDFAEFEAQYSSVYPVTSEDWLIYLEKHDMEFRSLMYKAGAKRSKLSERVKARPDVLESVRLYPVPSKSMGHSPRWSFLDPGIVCFKAATSSAKVTCFIANIGYQVYAVPLQSGIAVKVCDVLLMPTFDKSCVPLTKLLELSCIPDEDDTEVFALDWEVHRIHSDRVSVRILGAARIDRRARTVKAKSTEVGEDRDDVLPDITMEWDELGNRDSDMESMCSSDDATVESCEEDMGEDCEEDDKVRKTKGENVHYSNGYVTITNNTSFNDVKISVIPRWCTAEDLGVSDKSKTVVPDHFGDVRENPVRAFIVLRAWMLFKARHNDFCNKRAYRRRLFAEDLKSLKSDVEALSSVKRPTTGNDNADAFIRWWVPGVVSDV